MNYIVKKIKKKKLSKYWRVINQHNYTVLGSEPYSKNYEKEIKSGIISVGNGTYGTINFSSFGNPAEKLIIGNYCSIGGEVLFLLGGDHNYKKLSTYPFSVKMGGERVEATTKGMIVVDDDVWIGQRSTILSGVHIGKGAVIGAGSVVTKDIEPYTIAAGNPAKMIKLRFPKTIIEKLMQIDYSKINNEFATHHIDIFRQEIDEDNIDNVVSYLSRIQGESK